MCIYPRFQPAHFPEAFKTFSWGLKKPFRSDFVQRVLDVIGRHLVVYILPWATNQLVCIFDSFIQQTQSKYSIHLISPQNVRFFEGAHAHSAHCLLHPFKGRTRFSTSWFISDSHSQSMPSSVECTLFFNIHWRKIFHCSTLVMWTCCVHARKPRIWKTYMFMWKINTSSYMRAFVCF